MPTGPAHSTKPAYYADHAGESIQPVTGPIDVSSADFIVVHTIDGPLQITYQSIRSLSYSPAAVSASSPKGTIFHRLLTIGFYVANGVHHNLVVQLNLKDQRAILKAITARTGLKVGEPPQN